MKLDAAAVIRRPGWVLAFVALAIHLYASGGYGYFRDELYFIVCGERLDWGYVDQPPLVPLIAWLMHSWFPGSLVMLRLVMVSATDGRIREMFSSTNPQFLGRPVWFPSGKGLLFTQVDNSAGRYQLWTISFPEGPCRARSSCR